MRPEPIVTIAIVGRDFAIVAQLGAVRLAGVQLVALDARHTPERRHVPVQPMPVSASAACRICYFCRRTCHFNSIETKFLNQSCTCFVKLIIIV